MDVLFLHAHVPGHYEHLAPALAADPGNRVVFGTAAAGAAMARVDVRVLDPRRGTAAGHPYQRPLEDAEGDGEAGGVGHALGKGLHRPRLEVPAAAETRGAGGRA